MSVKCFFEIYFNKHLSHEAQSFSSVSSFMRLSVFYSVLWLDSGGKIIRVIM